MIRKQAARTHTASRTASGLSFLCAIAMLLMAPVFSLPAQATAPGDSGQTAAVDEPVSAPERATYLERHHAIKRVNQIKDRTLADIKRLKVLVANFGTEVGSAQADFEKIREMYHSAEKERYRRRFVESARLHDDTRKMISELYKKFTETFQNQTADLLAECAQNMVDAEFAVSGEPGQSPRSSTARIFHSSQKLNIAYQQTAMAEDMIRTDRYDEAITHLRLAKSFAINVLQNLEDSEQKQNEIEKKYKVDLLDARGLSSATGTESTP